MGIASRRPPLTVAMPTTNLSPTNATSLPSTPSSSTRLMPPFLASTNRRKSSSYEMLVAATGSLLDTPVTIQRKQLSASQQDSPSPEARTPGTRKDWLAMRGGALHLHSTPSAHTSSKRNRRPRPAEARSVSYFDAEGRRARDTVFATRQIRPDATVLAAAAANAAASDANRTEDSAETSSSSQSNSGAENSGDEGVKELPY